jgi:hypothetical protein
MSNRRFEINGVLAEFSFRARQFVRHPKRNCLMRGMRRCPFGTIINREMLCAAACFEEARAIVINALLRWRNRHAQHAGVRLSFVLEKSLFGGSSVIW